MRILARTMIFAACGAALVAGGPGRASAGLQAPNSASSTGQAPIAGEVAASAPILLAQAGDPLLRINQLEEELRRLNGQVEELRFQLLQAQEDMRKQQEDNEFRFQQIEGGSSSGGGSGSSGSQQRGEATPPAAGTPSTATASSQSQSESPTAAPADDIGQLLQDSAGVAGAGPATSTSTSTSTDTSNTVAAIKPEGAGEMYDLAYNYLLAGDYQLAEQSFRQYSQTYPNAADAPDARYWLGESLYQQQKYADAAEVFLDAQKDSPDNAKAPEMMLKLGMSLAKLNNRDVACTTYKEVSRRYPQMSANVKTKLASEEKAANC